MRLFTIARAAKELGISRQRLYLLVKQDRIPLTDVDGVKFIDMDTQAKWSWSKSEEETKTPKKRG